ncbi:MAG: hypothetical protein JSS76_00660 [Bacteroidetes bacterium]|nr:hypothetical protein [Bacteroidota bacterium]
MKIKYTWLFFLLLFTIANFIVYRHAINTNKKYLYGTSNMLATWDLRPPVCDSIFLPLHNWIEERKYQPNSYFESEVVDQILAKFPALRKSCDTLKFESLYDLVAYLSYQGQYSKEYEVLSYYTSPEFLRGNQLSKIDKHFFIKYIDDFYIVPAQYAVSNYEYDRAKWLIEEAYKRAILLHFPPLDKTSGYINNRLNRLYILKWLLKSPSACYRNALAVKDLYPALKVYPIFYDDTTGIEPNASIRANIRDSIFNAITNYWNGVALVRTHNYQEAQSLFASINTEDGSFEFNLLKLMEARCLIWSYLTKQRDDKAGVIQELYMIRNQMSIPHFSDDVDSYVSYLYQTQEASDSINANANQEL